jgi:hypothetical protein
MTDTVVILTPREAIKRIRPGAIKAVHLLFQARGGQVSLAELPKVRVRHMLENLPSDATVSVVIVDSRFAVIAGAIGPVRAGEISLAAGIARRLS